MNLILHTDRLCLKPLDTADYDVAVEMFTDPEVMKYISELMTEDEIQFEMKNWTKRGGNGCIGIWCITDLISAEKYGSVFLLPMPVDDDDTDYRLVVPGEYPDADIEIGFALKRSAWGRGHATQACKRLLQFAFEDSPLTEIVATFYDENTASRGVLEQCGFIDRGRGRCYGVDAPIYGLHRDEWADGRGSKG